jgi:hypothetical protein
MENVGKVSGKFKQGWSTHWSSSFIAYSLLKIPRTSATSNHMSFQVMPFFLRAWEHLYYYTCQFPLKALDYLSIFLQGLFLLVEVNHVCIIVFVE